MIELGGLNAAQVYSLQAETKAMVQPLELTYQNRGCWEGPVGVHDCIKCLSAICHSHQDLLHWTEKQKAKQQPDKKSQLVN